MAQRQAVRTRVPKPRACPVVRVVQVGRATTPAHHHHHRHRHRGARAEATLRGPWLYSACYSYSAHLAGLPMKQTRENQKKTDRRTGLHPPRVTRPRRVPVMRMDTRMTSLGPIKTVVFIDVVKHFVVKFFQTTTV
ncbi:hypothetical protein E2C01_092801 [Portunus trituberculatus]|uniref:Uncharacterized protein n=1 Tax=Portunus trituberculatus TaxID=210409 RepID=A0A5B7JSV2_PORTR|nr:hypothetical protein [Portunus trituberculatus]